MTPDQSTRLDQLIRMQKQLTDALMSYWEQYSNIYTWEFWFYVTILIIPFIVLYFYLDRNKALLLGFYGYSVHALFTYSDAFGVRNALWSYPYQAIPLFVGSFALDASFNPMIYMLVYQWTLNRNKNYYYYAILLSAALGFAFKPLLSAFGLFRLYNGTTYLHLFVANLAIALLAKWMTQLFLFLQRDRKEPPAPQRKLNLQRYFSRKQPAR